MHRLSAGCGFRYLLRDTASADVHRDPELPLTEYYATSGNPPGQWAGSGLAGLADEHGIPAGTVVTEVAMSAVFGHAADPVTGVTLGRPFPRRLDADGVRRQAGVAGSALGPDLGDGAPGCPEQDSDGPPHCGPTVRRGRDHGSHSGKGRGNDAAGWKRPSPCQLPNAICPPPRRHAFRYVEGSR